MSDPKLSIIIPCYNCTKTLPEAVDSCYNQGFSGEDFEVIMVDDGSTDGSAELIKKLAEQHDNIHPYFHEVNRGGGSARNTAVAHARSEVIFCLDSDDLLPPDTLSKMYSYLKEKNCDGVAFNFSKKFNGADPSNIHHVDEFPYAGEKIPFESLTDNSGNSCPLDVVFMYTKKAFDRAGGYPTDHGFDTQGFAWRFLAAGLIAYTCPGATYLHRVNFSRSYYIRESDNGLINFNWQKILLEHSNLLSDETINFVRTFDCSDFTRNLFSKLKNRDNIFKNNYRELLGTERVIKNKEATGEARPINRHSLRGLYLRARSRLRKIRIYGIAVFIYLKAVETLNSFLNHLNKMTGKTVPVLLYHRVASLSHDPTMLSINPDTFEEHIKYINRRYSPIPLTELIKRIDSKILKGDEICVTFDDGYRDNLTNALPILEKYSTPATIFITTYRLGQKSAFDLEKSYRTGEGATFLSETEIEKLSKHPLIEIGAHTHTHPRLSELPSGDQREEIETSKLILEKITKEKITHFAYPFGQKKDFTGQTLEIVRELGFLSAYENTDRLGTAKSNRYSFPRINIREISAKKLAEKIIGKY